MRPLRLVALAVVVAVSGCAAMQRETRARELAGEYVYQRPLDEIWPHVAALLASQGYAPQRGESPDVLETDWKQEVTGSSASGAWSRYVVVGKGDGKNSVVRILRNTRAVETRERVNESVDDRAVTNEDGTGRSVEQARYGINTEASGPLKNDEDVSAADAIAGTRASSSATRNATGTRDLNMEWLLLQRVDPEGAAKIFADAQAQ